MTKHFLLAAAMSLLAACSSGCCCFSNCSGCGGCDSCGSCNGSGCGGGQSCSLSRIFGSHGGGCSSCSACDSGCDTCSSGHGCSSCGGGCSSCDSCDSGCCGDCGHGMKDLMWPFNCSWMSGLSHCCKSESFDCPGGGCGEHYWCDWKSCPPTPDPCDHCGCYTGGCQCEKPCYRRVHDLALLPGRLGRRTATDQRMTTTAVWSKMQDQRALSDSSDAGAWGETIDCDFAGVTRQLIHIRSPVDSGARRSYTERSLFTQPARPYRLAAPHGAGIDAFLELLAAAGVRYISSAIRARPSCR